MEGAPQIAYKGGAVFERICPECCCFVKADDTIQVNGLDEIKQEGGRVISLDSYGSGLPAFEFNRNPMGYKFSWDPRTVFVAAQTPAAYLKNGRKIEVPGDQLFEHFWLVDITIASLN